MEIKAQLQKPYTEQERINFIIENNYKKGYEIKETDVALEAWGQNDEELLKQAKEKKYVQACEKAYSYLNSGEGLYEFEEGKHIEATGDNFAKLTPYGIELAMEEALNGGVEHLMENIMKMLSGEISGKTVQWTTKEDIVVNLNLIQIIKILKGIGKIQSKVWGTLFPSYKRQIEEAQTVEEVDAIEINYEVNL